MKKLFVQLTLLFQAIFCLSIFMALPFQTPLMAQSVITAQNTALGGGGTAYLSGFEAVFYNPANLAIPDRPGNVHIGIGHGGALYEPVLSRTAPQQQASNFVDYLLPYSPGKAALTDRQRNNILANNYPRNNLTSQHRSRTDLILGGLLVQRSQSAFSIVARTRIGSHISTGRGWYDDSFSSTEEQQIRDFTLKQQRNQLYELSVGYAREFTFINGLFPRLSKLYVGIAPKVVVSGPRFDASYDAQYIQEPDNSYYQTNFSYRSTGSFTALTDIYRSSGNPQGAINGTLDRFDFQPSGMGVGFDFGLTYLVPLNNDLPSISSEASAVYTKSLRFAFSVTDLGLVQEQRNPLYLNQNQQTIQGPEQSPASTFFMGSGGQYLSFLHDAEALPNPVLQANEGDRSEYLTLLPTSVNAGFLLDLYRLKLMGDVTVGLDNTAFSTTALAASMGIEIRPLKNIPLRAGSRFTSNLPVHIGLGTGYESRYWDFLIGSQIFFPSETLTPDIVGGGFAGIQLHL